MAYPCRLFACRAMYEVCYTSELLILCSLSVELFLSTSLLDLLNTIGLPAKHTPSLIHHNRQSFDHTQACLADCELLHFYASIHVVRLMT